MTCGQGIHAELMLINATRKIYLTEAGTVSALWQEYVWMFIICCMQ